MKAEVQQKGEKNDFYKYFHTRGIEKICSWLSSLFDLAQRADSADSKLKYLKVT